MALTDEASKAIYLEELEAEYGTIADEAIAEQAANVITKTINRILLELVQVGPGSFTTSMGPVTGEGEIS